MTIKENLEPLKIGDTLLQEWQFVNSTTGDPLPQSGRSYNFTLKRHAAVADEDASSSVSFTCPDNELSSQGIVIAKLEASQTLLLQPAVYQYELKETVPADPEEIVLTWFYGTIKLEH